MSDLRKFPKQEKRVETGPIQFGDDWPGLFIRGDNALGFALALKDLNLPETTFAEVLHNSQIKELTNLLFGCDAGPLDMRAQTNEEKKDSDEFFEKQLNS